MRLPLHGESSIGVRCDDQLMDEPISARSWRTSRKNKHNSRTKRNRSANRSTRIHDHRQKAFHPSALLLVSLITLSCVTRLLASRVAFFFPRFAVDKARSETKIRPQRRGKRVRYRSHRMHDPPSAFLPWNFFFSDEDCRILQTGRMKETLQYFRCPNRSLWCRFFPFSMLPNVTGFFTNPSKRILTLSEFLSPFPIAM